jgi:diguanylate cyclase (GGDEF)-like protein/PAS domain S-box-containing protein
MERRADDDFSARTGRQQQALMRLLSNGLEYPFRRRVRLILQSAAEALRAERVGYWEFFAKASRLRCEEVYGRSREGYGPCGEIAGAPAEALVDALKGGAPLVECDASGDPRFAFRYGEGQGAGAVLAVPVHVLNQLIGALIIEHCPDTRDWQVDEQNFAVSVAQLLMLANKARRLERAEEALRASEARFRAIVEASPTPMVVITVPHGECVYGNAAAAEALGLQRVGLAGKQAADFYDDASDGRRVLLAFERQGALVGREVRVRLSDGQLAWFSVSAQRIELAGRKLAVVGFLDVSRHIRLESALRHMAMHDGLTGLPNRALFNDMLQRELAHARRTQGYLFAVLFIDLDNFKEVNDHFGHATGDKLLVKLAERVRQCLRPKDLFARMGGDEFAVLLSEVTSAEEVRGIADRINHVLSEHTTIAGHELGISGSIGVVMDRPTFDTPDRVMRAADKAMYRAKALGRNRYVVFDGQAIQPRRTGLHPVLPKKSS